MLALMLVAGLLRGEDLVVGWGFQGKTQVLTRNASVVWPQGADGSGPWGFLIRGLSFE